MSRTFKDRPYRLGGDRHKWYCVNNHGSHGKFIRLMSRLTRVDLKREMMRDPDTVPKKSRYQKYYFD